MPKKNEETLSESGELLQGTIDALSGLIAILDKRGNIIAVNRAWLDLAGIYADDGNNYGVGSNFIEACKNLTTNEIGAKLAKGITEVIKGKRKSFEIEYAYQSRFEPRWYVTRVVPFGAGENLRVIVNHENITQRKFTEIALRESEESYRILAHTASDVIIKIDTNSTILFINSAGERVFGYKPAVMIGQSLTMIMPENLRERHRKGFIRYLRTGKRKLSWESMEIPALHKDGHIFPLEISFGEFNQKDGHFFIGVARDISGRKHTEKATAHLAAIVKSSDDAIISKDLQGIITSWNKGAEKIFGYTAEEIIGLPITTLVPPYLLKEEAKILESIKKGRQIEHFETIRRRKDGNDINISLAVSPIQDEAGNITGASKIARDITERIETEETLRENQMMLALAMQSSRMGAWEQDIATDVVIWSEELEEIFGLKKGEFAQTRTAFYDLIYEDDREKVFAEVSNAIAARRDYTIEFRFYHADGSIRWMEGRGQAVYSDKGAAVRLYGIGIDITERKLAEENLRESERLFQTLADSVPQLVWTANPDGSRTWFNQRWYDYTGSTFEDVKDWGWQSFHHPQILPEVMKKLQHSVATGETFEMEFPLRGADGAYRWFLTRMTPMRDAEGKIIRWFGTNTDIHDNKVAEMSVRFLDEIGEDLTRLRSAEEIMRNVGEKISKYLNVSRVFFTEVNLETDTVHVLYDYCKEDLPSTAGVYQFSSFLSEDFIRKLSEGKTVAVGDVANDPRIDAEAYRRLGIGSHIHAPYISNGQFKFLLAAQHRAAYNWRKDEIELMREIASRVWTRLERARAEDKLRESQSHLKLTTEAAKVATWQWDTSTNKIVWSPLHKQMWGYEPTPEPIDFKDWAKLLHAEDLQTAEQAIENSLKNHVPYDIEYRIFPLGSSETRWIHSSGQVILGVSGEPAQMLGISQDITERKQAQETIRESEERFRLLADNAPVLIWLNDTQGCYYANRQYLDFVGAKNIKDVRGIDWAQFVHEDDRENYINSYLEAFEKREKFVAQFRFRRYDGEFRWMTSTGLPRFSGSGEFLGYVGSTLDIHDMKTAQEEIIKAERRANEDYQALLARIVPLAQTLGTARNLLTIYRTVAEFARASMPCTAFFLSFYEAEKSLRIAAYAWGDKGEVDISTLPPMLLTEDGGPNSQAIFKKKSVVVNRYMDIMKSRPHFILQEDGIDPNSSLVVPMTVMNRTIGTLEVQAYQNDAFTHEHIVALEMVANLAAVSIENVRLLEVEAAARKEAEAANRAKDEFLSVLSHELRTPLNAMLGWTRMLKTGILDDERKAQAIETIERNARLQNNLIEDLLDVSRIISGKMRIENEEVDIVSVVKTCIETAKPLAGEKNISLTFKSDLPSQKLNGDTTRLQQIVNNLLSNAIKFTPKDGKISVNVKQEDDKVFVKVKDTGIGISPEFLPMIFDRFKQADSTTKRSHSGLGLGMTIVRHLTELHGGRVEVFSQGEGFGSTFTIVLPVDFSAGKAVLSSDSNKEKEKISKLKGAKILLVDDDCEGIQPLQILLEAEEADVHCADSAREALKKISEQHFDILVSDIGMPEMDGFELIAEVKKLTKRQNRRLPAIALTAYASIQDRARALSAGYQTHLSKPVDFEQFLSAVNNLLNNHHNE